MRKEMMALIIVATFLAFALSVGVVTAQGGDDQPNLALLVNKLDTSISSLRKGDDSGALLSEASTIYNENFSPLVENRSDNELNTKIVQAFTSLTDNPTEENIFALRSDVLRAASLIGVYLPPLYAYSLFIVLGISVIVSLLITLLTKRLVNWEFVRDAKAKTSEFQKELYEAKSKKDMKQLHKIQQRQAEITKLQGKMFSQTLKPTIIYMIPMMLLWYMLIGAYGGWAIAWLPFRIDLPIFGPLVAFGVGWWYFITYLGFSQIFRKILIRD